MKTLNLALAAVLATVVYCGAQMPGQQPGMGQPGMGQPGMGQPGMGGGIPGMGEPGMGGNGQTSTTNPNMNQPMVDDQTLDRQVHEQLRTQSELSNVHSRVQNGVVYLEGAVPNKKDRKRAEHLVQSVPGVRGVKNELKVEPATTSELTNTGQQTGAVDSAGAGATSGDTSSADSPSPTSSALAEGSESGAFSSAELESRLNNSMWNDPALSGSSLRPR